MLECNLKLFSNTHLLANQVRVDMLLHVIKSFTEKLKPSI